MGRKCCVSGCNFGAKCTLCQASLSYFKLPKNPIILKQWEMFLGLKDTKLHSRDRVCSTHFKKYDILTKRFVSMKRPSTNSKMILEISKLVRGAIPTILRNTAKQCTHGKAKKTSNKTKSSRLESGSERATSQSDETDDDTSSECRTAKNENRQEPRSGQKDYNILSENFDNCSKYSQLCTLRSLRAKWLEKRQNFEKDILLLEERINELTNEIEKNETSSFDSD